MFKLINKKAACFMLAASMLFGTETMPMQSRAAEVKAEVNAESTTVSTGSAVQVPSGEVVTTGTAVTVKKPSKVNIYANKALVVSGKKVTVYKKASTKSTKVGQMKKGDLATVLKKKGSWIKIESGKVTGYAKKKYFVLGKKIEKKEKKYGKKYKKSNGKTAYKFSKAITWKQVLKKKENAKIKKGKAVVNYAEKYVGNRYRYGGTSLTHGTDCSGFAMRVYQKFGKHLPRTSREQSRVGKKVSRSKLHPGDLLFFKHGRRIGHVAIYAGNGKIVHAASTKLGIIKSNLNGRHIAVARRLV